VCRYPDHHDSGGWKEPSYDTNDWALLRKTGNFAEVVAHETSVIAGILGRDTRLTSPARRTRGAQRSHQSLNLALIRSPQENLRRGLARLVEHGTNLGEFNFAVPTRTEHPQMMLDDPICDQQ
jgi:hypothetical protein